MPKKLEFPPAGEAESLEEKVELDDIVGGLKSDWPAREEGPSLLFSGWLKYLRQSRVIPQLDTYHEFNIQLFTDYVVLPQTNGPTEEQIRSLDLVTLINFAEPPIQRPAGLFWYLRSLFRPEPCLYPFTIYATARLGGPLTLYAPNELVRSTWKARLEEAITSRVVAREKSRVFRVEMLVSETFGTLTGEVTCSVPFSIPNRGDFVAIGCTNGVWVLPNGDPTAVRRVLDITSVTQCAVLEGSDLFLVLADKSLRAYTLDQLVPNKADPNDSFPEPLETLSTKANVSFFRVGQLNGRTLVIYLREKCLDSIFHVYEVVPNKQPRAPRFRKYRDFYLQKESFDVIFLKARLAILCNGGFEIMDLDDFKSVTIPPGHDLESNKFRRLKSCRPLGILRATAEEFLLVYDECGVYTNKHGDILPDCGVIEWEGTAERVAVHHPYILLFDSRFIEVRSVQSGRLVQIIQGSGIKCAWDGETTNVEQNGRIHGVMNGENGSKEIFALVPFCSPGSEQSPFRTSQS